MIPILLIRFLIPGFRSFMAGIPVIPMRGLTFIDGVILAMKFAIFALS
jgi:hypothetical protein